MKLRVKNVTYLSNYIKMFCEIIRKDVHILLQLVSDAFHFKNMKHALYVVHTEMFIKVETVKHAG